MMKDKDGDLSTSGCLIIIVLGVVAMIWALIQYGGNL